VKFTTTLAQFQSDLWGFHFDVPVEIAKKLIDGKNRRVICTINNSLTYPCALMPNGSGGFFITVNKANRKTLNLTLGDEISIHLERDGSKYGMPIPEELVELLKQDPEGDKLFHELLPGKQRNLIHLVAKYKHSDTRLTKALVIVNYLKDSQGRLDFKELNQAFKEANNLLF
jgi:hypothetical protein